MIEDSSFVSSDYGFFDFFSTPEDIKERCRNPEDR